jgi:hypothetical protein
LKIPRKDFGMSDGFRLSGPSARIFDAIAGRVGASVAGGGRPFFQQLPEQVQLRLVEAIPAPGATHLHYEVAR